MLWLDVSRTYLKKRKGDVGGTFINSKGGREEGRRGIQLDSVYYMGKASSRGFIKKTKRTFA